MDDIIDSLGADELWALLSMRVLLVDSDQPHAQSAAVRFGASVPVTSSSYSTIVPQVSYRTPMAQASFQRLARSSPPFPGGAVVDRQPVADQDTAEVFSENVAQEVTSAALSFFELIQFSIDSVASKLLSQC
jgi:hypothetical protein